MVIKKDVSSPEVGLRMKPINKIALSIALCAVLQACSSASDNGVSPGSAGENAQAAIPSSVGENIQVPTPASLLPDQDSNATIDEPENTNTNSATETTTEQLAPLLVANALNVECEAPTAEFQSTMLAVINDSRSVARMCGDTSHAAVDSVTWNNQLANAANAHAQDMVNFNFFSHDGSDGLSVSDRADSAGYDWRAVGENIAAGQMNIGEVHEGWLDSPGHCRNIVNTLYTEVGAACIVSDNTDYRSYWVVVFGNQP